MLNRRWFARAQRRLESYCRRKKQDRRGRHTKESRAKKRAALMAHIQSICSVVCNNCSGTEFVDTTDGANRVCNQCGLVDETARSMPDTVSLEDQLRSGLSSSVYRHRNYFAERMRQFSNTEPRLSTLEKSQIYAVQSFLERKIGPEWTPGRLSKDKFGQICRILDQLRPGKRWRQKLEKWHQAKISLSGRCDYVADLPPESLVEQMKVLFDGFALIFERYFRGSEQKSNIPKLDLVCLLLMYNIDRWSLWLYGWFFMNPQIWWESESTQKDYERCARIFQKTNECLVALEPRKTVRRETLFWFRKNKLVLPSLNELRSWVPWSYDRDATVAYQLKLVS